ncbi:solute carrier family 22 member 3 isoform X1 [Plutella xylostella]|uniref:solute carrier family 22 member 3 isoform X1 n=2 Tax=Plutella xylostella TaxID=51655 RepID=UPI0020321EC3|nr:solute carrier family 22 member 3 isoform X1 [Plutella xylostella]
MLTYVGEMGRYQRLLFVMMLPFGFAWAFGYFGQMFLTATPQQHWCRVPELESLDMELRRNLSIPRATTGEGYDTCLMYDADWGQVLATLTPPDPGTPTVKCRHGWEFQLDDIPYPTIVSEREWVCDKANRVPWSQTISFIGTIVGGMIMGRIADKFGRLPALICANTLGFFGSLGTTFTDGFWDFVICRFLVGMSIDTCFIMLYIIIMEYVGTTHRTWVANLSIAMFFGGGCVLLPFMALWISNWRTLSIVMSIPSLLVLLAPFTIPESTRWYVSRGKVEKAVKMLHRFEKVNKTKIPKDALDEFVTVATAAQESGDSIKILFKIPSLRTMLLLLMSTFMAIAVIFDILIRLSETLGGDFFITFALASATEIPATLVVILLLDRFGRRLLVCSPLVVGAVLSLTAAFVPRGVPSVALAIAARFFNNMAYNVIIQWTPELLPTTVRATGASSVHVSAYFTVMLSPFIVYSVSILVINISKLMCTAVRSTDVYRPLEH